MARSNDARLQRVCPKAIRLGWLLLAAATWPRCASCGTSSRSGWTCTAYVVSLRHVDTYVAGVFFTTEAMLYCQELAESAMDRPSIGQEFRLRTIGISALHTAAWGGHVGVLQYLLESGQCPDASSEGGTTPIMVAIHRFNVTTMRCVFRGREAVRRNLVVDVRISR